MGSKVFSSLEIDAIGEVLNISLGASATAVSSLLSKRVDITIPAVTVSNKENFEILDMQPAVGVEIVYLSGLSGRNIMLLKKRDVRIIVGMLMGEEIPEENFELNELNLSAIHEVMNQMMGASATALSELLGNTVNISTPTSYEISASEEFKEKYLLDNDEVVVIKFILNVENITKIEFLNIMAVGLAKELLSCVGVIPSEDLEDEISETGLKVKTEPEEPFSKEDANKPFEYENFDKQRSSLKSREEKERPEAPDSSDQNFLKPLNKEREEVSEGKKDYAPRVINVTPKNRNISEEEGVYTEREENLNLIMDVSLEVSVEIGRTKKYVKEILDYNQGSLIVLDKLAGEQVDVFVNGRCIAKGDVVVVDDCFGVRVTEVLKKV